VVAPSLTAHPRPRTGRGYLSAVSLVFHRPQSAGELLDVSLGPLSFVVYSIGEAGVSFAAWQLLHRRPVDAPAVWTRVRRCFGSVTVGYTVKWIGVEDLFPAATEAAG
jgi:hypothetical protein